jgi:Cytochrome c7 and related cytochrome c
MPEQDNHSRSTSRLTSFISRVRSIHWTEKVSSLIKKPIFLISFGIFIILFLSAASYGIWLTQQPPEQPIRFNHSLHIGFGVQCLYCHPNAWKGNSPGLPTETKCWGCHQQIPIKDADQQKLADAVNNNQPIQWVPVFILPDFVYFNHRPMVAAGISCETCHGEMSREITAQPRKGINMGWCLHCHRTRAANDPILQTRLTDCGTCHR